MSQHSSQVSVRITGADKKSQIIFSNEAETPLPPSAGAPVSVVKNASQVVTAVHGNVSNTSVIFDNPG